MEAGAARAEVASLKSGSLKTPIPKNCSFKSKGIEQQFTTNQSVLDKVDAAMRTLSDDSPASSILMEGKTVLEKRQKQLKIADSFDWQTAQIYEDGAVGSDMSDDKKIVELFPAAATARRMRFLSRSPGNSFAASNFRAPRGRGYGPFANGGRLPGNHPTNPNIQCWSCGQSGHVSRNSLLQLRSGQRPFPPATIMGCNSRWPLNNSLSAHRRDSVSTPQCLR